MSSPISRERSRKHISLLRYRSRNTPNKWDKWKNKSNNWGRQSVFSWDFSKKIWRKQSSWHKRFQFQLIFRRRNSHLFTSKNKWAHCYMQKHIRLQPWRGSRYNTCISFPIKHHVLRTRHHFKRGDDVSRSTIELKPTTSYHKRSMKYKKGISYN